MTTDQTTDQTTEQSTDLTMSFTVDRSPHEAYVAVTDPRSWWSGTIEGSTDELGAVWSYEVPDIHRSTFRTTELVPDTAVAWHVLDAWLSFTEDKQEWTGTTIRFAVTAEDDGARVTFTHEGLRPQHECYQVCRTAWSQYVLGSLRTRIASGSGTPNAFEGPEALAAAQAGTAEVPTA